MKLFNKAAIIGVGLIGGSIGLSIKKKKLASRVIGIGRHKNKINSAIARGAIDAGFFDISAVSQADLVIIATPVNSIIQFGTKIAPLIKPGTLVTDTGSTKKSVVKALEGILPNFVGSHPLAGSEKQGVINARADLFDGSLCVLTPTKKTPKNALSKVKKLWIDLGAKLILLSPAEHDKLVSCISHLPHVVAFSLIHSIPDHSLFLASKGLKDATRIADSSVALWRDIFLTNSKNVLDALKKFKGSLSKIESAIAHQDIKALERILNQARQKRQKLNHK
ncbi:MAG: prephenate dehydrogenase [Candidatus Omnitrophota bacterium]